MRPKIDKKPLELMTRKMTSMEARIGILLDKLDMLEAKLKPEKKDK